MDWNRLVALAIVEPFGNTFRSIPSQCIRATLWRDPYLITRRGLGVAVNGALDCVGDAMLTALSEICS